MMTVSDVKCFCILFRTLHVAEITLHFLRVSIFRHYSSTNTAAGNKRPMAFYLPYRYGNHFTYYCTIYRYVWRYTVTTVTKKYCLQCMFYPDYHSRDTIVVQ